MDVTNGNSIQMTTLFDKLSGFRDFYPCNTYKS